ncbi:hypothetical protein OROMI_014550 [Orobanche minor]
MRTLLAPTTPTSRSFRSPKLVCSLQELCDIDFKTVWICYGTGSGIHSQCSSDCRSSIGSTDYSTFSYLCDVACFIPGLHVSILFSTGSTNPLVGKPAGFTALSPLISVAPGVSAPPTVSPPPDLLPYWCSLRPCAVLVVIEPLYSVQIYFLVCDSSHLIEDCCVVDSFGKSIVLDCFKIQNLLLSLKKCNTKGRYDIRAARFIKGIVTAPILFAIEEFPELHPIIYRGFDKPGDVDLVSPVLLVWYAQDNMVHDRILLQRFLKDKLSNM